MTRDQRQSELHRILKLSDGRRRIILLWKKTVADPAQPKPRVGTPFTQLIRDILEREYAAAK